MSKEKVLFTPVDNVEQDNKARNEILSKKLCPGLWKSKKITKIERVTLDDPASAPGPSKKGQWKAYTA